MQLNLTEPRRKRVKADRMIRAPESAPPFDIRNELSEEFLSQWQEAVISTFIHGESSESGKGAVAAYQLRQQLEPVSVLEQALGRSVLPLNPADQRLVERKIKTGLKDFSHITQKLREGKFQWWDGLKELASYHEASRVERPPLLGDEVWDFFQRKIAEVPTTLDVLLSLLRLRPDKRSFVREYATIFHPEVERGFQNRFGPLSTFGLPELNVYLLIFPEKRGEFKVTDHELQQGRQEIQGFMKTDLTEVMPTAFQVTLATAQEAWIDEKGKIRVRMPPQGMGAQPALPERPLT